MKNKSIYIAGPMRGIEYYNFPAFDKARNELTKQGHLVISPADIDRNSDGLALGEYYPEPEGGWGETTGDFKDIVRRDTAAIIENCFALYMLPGWEDSKGACAEHAIACWLGLEIIFDPDCKQECVLTEAARITRGDRQNAYGPADQDFTRTAKLWTALFEHKLLSLIHI